MNHLKHIENEKDLESIVQYCIEKSPCYVTYDIINGYLLTYRETESIRNTLTKKGFNTDIIFNSHNVKCFWVR